MRSSFPLRSVPRVFSVQLVFIVSGAAVLLSPLFATATPDLPSENLCIGEACYQAEIAPSDGAAAVMPASTAWPMNASGIPYCGYECNASGRWTIVPPFDGDCDSTFLPFLPVPCPTPYLVPSTPTPTATPRTPPGRETNGAPGPSGGLGGGGNPGGGC